MRNYSSAQTYMGLQTGDIVTIRHRPNLSNALYRNIVYRYFLSMDRFIGMHGVIINQDPMGLHVRPRLDFVAHGYTYYMVDKVETYNIEEDI